MVISRNTISGLRRYLPKRFFSRPMQVVLDLVVLTALDDLSDPEGVGFYFDHPGRAVKAVLPFRYGDNDFQWKTSFA